MSLDKDTALMHLPEKNHVLHQKADGVFLACPSGISKVHTLEELAPWLENARPQIIKLIEQALR